MSAAGRKAGGQGTRWLRPAALSRVLLALVAVAVVILGAALPALAENRVALVIGNAGYATARLPNPRNDADLMARTLKAVGFEVIVRNDADMPAMRAAFIEFSRRLKRADSVGVFYYAGHAVQVAGQNYLVPVGADITGKSEIPVQAVNLQELLGAMKGAAARVKIAILDACRNNPFESSVRDLTRGLAPVVAPAGTLIAYATAPGEVALDGRSGNSPFTAALARTMPTPGLTVEEVFKRTRAAVLEATQNQQTPWEHSSLVGDFVFVPKSAPQEPSGGPVARSAPGDEEARRLAEIADWERIRANGDAAAFRRHLATYPGGAYEELAHYKIAQLETKPSLWSVFQTGAAGKTATRDIDAAFERAVKLEASQEPQALIEAARLYRAAADQGVVTAMVNLGRMYDRGRGVGRSAPEAVYWYGKAAEAQHPGAQAALATLYEIGDGVAVDLAEAVRLYRLAADEGDVHGETSLGYLYATGKGVARDPVAARRLYLSAAEKGAPRAMFNLALLLLRGEGGGQDPVEAIRWLNVAVDKGHSGAMRELAYLHDEGRFVDRSAARAAEYFVASLEALKAEAAVSGRAAQAKVAAESLIRKDHWSFSTKRAVQKRLIAQGRYNGPATGLFDIGTRRVLERLASVE